MMPSWKVEITSKTGQSAMIDLIDTLGPLNEWRSEDPGALLPAKGNFINQFGRIIPSEQPSWFLSDFDIDKVQIGSSGWGEILKNKGWFPAVEIQWKVIASL